MLKYRRKWRQLKERKYQYENNGRKRKPNLGWRMWRPSANGEINVKESWLLSAAVSGVSGEESVMAKCIS